MHKDAFYVEVSRDNGSTWSRLGTTDYSPSNDGSVRVTVNEVEEVNGTTIALMYRFVEKLPSGYYDAQGGTGDENGEVRSATLTPKNLTPSQRYVEMYNMKGGDIELTKHIVRVNDDNTFNDIVVTKKKKGENKPDTAAVDYFNKIDTQTSSFTVGSQKPVPAKFANLTQGGTYYLKETSVTVGDNTATTDYIIESVKDAATGLDLTKEGDYYVITIPEPEEGEEPAAVNVDFTNKYLKAQVTILKYDGDDEEHPGLSGAEFEVLVKNAAGEWVPANGATVTASETDAGVYTAVIPLTETGDYLIHETKSPDPAIYAIDADLEKSSVKVTGLNPGDNLTYSYAGDLYTLPNYEGAHIKLTKMGGVPGSDNISPLANVKFQLWFSYDGTNWSKWHQPETTGLEGTTEFLALQGYYFAISEVDVPRDYVGLYGIYHVVNGREELLPTTEVEDLTTGNTYTIYILNKDDITVIENGGDFLVKGYNVP